MSTGSTKGKSRRTEILEVEDEETRQERMHAIFQQLDATGASPSMPPEGPPKYDFGDRTTFPAPPSDLLSRVREFLPELAASNAELARQAEQDPSSVDMEEVGDSEQYIEMNLGLGVFEDRRPREAKDDNDEEMDDADSSESSGEDESDSGSNSDTASDTSSGSGGSSNSEDSEGDIGMKQARPIKPLPKRRRPEIVVLSDIVNPGASNSS